MVLKVAPSPVNQQADAKFSASGMHAAVFAIHNSGQFWKDALDLERRAVNV